MSDERTLIRERVLADGMTRDELDEIRKFVNQPWHLGHKDAVALLADRDHWRRTCDRLTARIDHLLGGLTWSEATAANPMTDDISGDDS